MTSRFADARTQIFSSLTLYVALVLAWLALAPGMDGNFIFDDSWNLRNLERIAHNPTFREALDYTVVGFSSSIGRPLTLATFAVQYASWPWHPEDFLRVNILLHLLNGCLLFWVLARLGRLMGASPQRGIWLAVAVSALWMFAPLQGSAVLYVVQRMAVLAGTCMFIGMLLYLWGREKLANGDSRSGLAWMSLGMLVGTLIGVLAKENAGLFPLCVGVVELTVLRNLGRRGIWPAWGIIFIVTPIVLLAAYVGYRLPEYVLNEFGRDFTMWERLLTESRVLFLYLQKLAFPSLYSIRLLYDDLPLSRGLLDPASTLVCSVAWLALAGSAFGLRRKAPVFSFAVLWFLGNHLLESTIIPLEPAFEHRNYVASVGPLYALAWYVARILDRAEVRRIRPVLVATVALYYSFQVTALWQSASLWGRPLDQMRYWASTQPESTRAQLQLADTYLAHYEFDSAVSVLESAMEHWPGDPSAPLAILEIGCYIPQGPVPSLKRLQESARRFDGQVLSVINMLDRLITAKEEGNCERYSPAELYAIIEVMAEAPEFRFQRRNLLLMRSRVAELAKDREAARLYLDQAVRMNPVIALLVQGTVWALQAGDIDKAREYADLAAGIRSVNPFKQLNYHLAAEDLRRVVDLYSEDQTEPGEPTSSPAET